MAKKRAVENWVAHPATTTQFLDSKNKEMILHEGDVFTVPSGAVRCVKGYVFPPKETYRWVIPAAADIARVLKLAGKQTFRASQPADAAAISGGKPQPNGNYHMQRNFEVTDVRMITRYERLKP